MREHTNDTFNRCERHERGHVLLVAESQYANCSYVHTGGVFMT